VSKKLVRYKHVHLLTRKTLDAKNLFPIAELTRLPMPPDVLLFNQEINMCPYTTRITPRIRIPLAMDDAYVTLTRSQLIAWPIYPGADPPETQPVGGSNPTQHMIAASFLCLQAGKVKTDLYTTKVE
jgi:hypothetical protein